MGDLLGSPRVASRFLAPFFALLRHLDPNRGRLRETLLFRIFGWRPKIQIFFAGWDGPAAGAARPASHREACGGTEAAREERIKGIIMRCMSDAIIPALKHRIPSELRS